MSVTDELLANNERYAAGSNLEVSHGRRGRLRGAYHRGEPCGPVWLRRQPSLWPSGGPVDTPPSTPLGPTGSLRTGSGVSPTAL